jgi:hypothetical protein
VRRSRLHACSGERYARQTRLTARFGSLSGGRGQLNGRSGHVDGRTARIDGRTSSRDGRFAGFNGRRSPLNERQTRRTDASSGLNACQRTLETRITSRKMGLCSLNGCSTERNARMSCLEGRQFDLNESSFHLDVRETRRRGEPGSRYCGSGTLAVGQCVVRNSAMSAVVHGFSGNGRETARGRSSRSLPTNRSRLRFARPEFFAAQRKYEFSIVGYDAHMTISRKL